MPLLIKHMFVHFTIMIIAVESIFKSKYGKHKRSVRYSNDNCYGNEKRLADCAHHTLEFDTGRTHNTEVAGVDCHGKNK